MDPVTGGVAAILLAAMIVFTYFARQEATSDQYELFTKNLVIEKKPPVKTKPIKSKKERKTERRRAQYLQETPTVLGDNSSAQEVPFNEDTGDFIDSGEDAQESKEKHEVPENPQPLIGEESTPSDEPDLVNVETIVEKKAEEPSRKEDQVDVLILSSTEVQTGEKASPKAPLKHSHSKKKKKAALPASDLDEQKILSHLADIEDVEPECVSFLAQFFSDTNDKIGNLSATISILEKTTSDLRQKAEQHCVSRMIAEKEAQAQQRLVLELTKKVTQFEKDLQTSNAQIEQYKKNTSEGTAVIKANTEMKAELERLKQTEQSAQQQIQALQQQLKECEVKADAANKEIQCLRSAHDANRQFQTERNELHDELLAREATIALIRSEFAELELLARDLVHEKEKLEKQVYIEAIQDEKKIKKQNNEALRMLAHEWQTKANEWKIRETTLLGEQCRLTQIVANLQKQVDSLDEIRNEKVLLENRIHEMGVKLEKRTKDVSAEEIIISKLQAENESLKTKLDQVQSKFTEFTEEHNNKMLVLNNRMAQKESEVVSLKKENTYGSSTNNQLEFEKLIQEINRLSEKNEELRSRNHTVLKHMHEMEANCNGNGKTKPLHTITISPEKNVLETSSCPRKDNIWGEKLQLCHETLLHFGGSLATMENAWFSQVNDLEKLVERLV